jgi:hypothetical protein
MNSACSLNLQFDPVYYESRNFEIVRSLRRLNEIITRQANAE